MMRPARLLLRAAVMLATLAGLASATAGCCTVIDLIPKPVQDEDDDLSDPPAADDDGKSPTTRKPRAGRLDLGTASYPANNKASVTLHNWTARANLSPRKYRVGYQLADASEKTSEGGYHRWATKLGHKKIGKDRFQWRPPPRCRGGLHCVYEHLAAQDRDAVEPLVKLFRARADKAKLNALQAAALVVTFGQEITYRIPDEQPFGIMPPAVVADRKNGDCDSKSLLVHMILRRLGVDSVLISSKKHKHTMLGVALPAPGSTFTYNGRRYAFVELTAKRSPIGHINPKLLRPNDWRVDPMPYKVGRTAANTKKKSAPLVPGKRSVETPMNNRIRIDRR